MRAVPSSVSSRLASASCAPILLFILDMPGATLRYAAYPSNVTFGGNTYTAWEIKTGRLTMQATGQIDRLRSIEFDNTDRTMDAIFMAKNIAGRKITILRVFADNLSDSDCYQEIFSGIMEPPEYSGNWVQITATQGKPLVMAGVSKLYSKTCPLVFGGSQCNADGYSNIASTQYNMSYSGTATGGSALTLVCSSLPSTSDDHWKHGTITITKSGWVVSREVKASSGTTITWEIPLPYVVDAACTFGIIKGCDRLWETCCNLTVWGPRADNRLNYGGFLHLDRPRASEL